MHPTLVINENQDDEDLRLRPDLPIKALPDEGCLLLHRMARSYGASQTHLLCRSVPLSSLPLDSPTLNDLRLRTYLNIHSPTMV
jgi:hypothetical protein